MKKIRLLLVLSVILILAACSGGDEKEKAEEPSSEGVGFSLSGDSIEEAENIPAEEKEQIIQVFNAYIEAFNQRDVEAYFKTLSEDTESFDLEEERIYIEEIFAEYELKREASEIVIVKYADAEAQVFANLQTSMKQVATGLEMKPTGRQVTVLTKEDGEWKVTAIHYIGDSEE